MDKWTHYLEPPLGAQLPTPVTLATHCLGHSHGLVEQMEAGHRFSLFVKASVCQIVRYTMYYSAVFIVANCDPLFNPTNGQVDTSSGTTFGSLATFSCNTGYRLSHQQMVMCGADGVWFPASPSCIGESKLKLLACMLYS